MADRSPHLSSTLAVIAEYRDTPDSLILTGHDLSITHILTAALKPQYLTINMADVVKELLKENAKYLSDVISNGKIIYGINTGYGGSADVTSEDILEIQKSLIRHLNAGFGETLPTEIVRAVMLARANSLCRGYSGVRPEIVQMLLDMLTHDIIPVVPKRGSISASGDLMPTSYIAACMMGRRDAKVVCKGVEMLAPQALQAASIQPIEFICKEALAVVNAASFASSFGGMLLYDANVAAVLTQVATAMTVESLQGRMESFHPTIHKCMPHEGQREAARNISHLLKDSKFAVQELEQNRNNIPGKLKQDRYALRTSPQWLAPVLETLQASIRRIMIEINSANDNPIIDHHNKEILHGGNFQGVSITVAMDQARQALQLCGKLLFAQMSEILNWKYSNGLPPNLNGSDINTDFGFKGTDTAMASYCSELDYLTPPLTNHVLSAEMHNQGVNSMALVSARTTSQALEILQMMLANILRCQVQAIDLRWLQNQVETQLRDLVTDDIQQQYRIDPWYNFAFSPTDTFSHLFDMDVVTKNGHAKEEFVQIESSKVKVHLQQLSDTTIGSKKVAEQLGKGTAKMYTFIRQTLGIPFYVGTEALDTSLQKIFSSIQDRQIEPVVMEMYTDLIHSNI